LVRFSGLFLLLWAAFGGAAYANKPRLDVRLSNICYQAIDRAVQIYDVPRDVMLAITLTETGRNFEGTARPWPWTVNMEGKGHWFADRPSALAYVRRQFDRGARSFDVGCFQINYKWHHQHFRSIEDMFDPVINATYAAKFLSELYQEKGNWSAAAGAYHSRTPSFATRYSARFDRYLTKIADGKFGPALGGHGSEPLQLTQAPAQAAISRPASSPSLFVPGGRNQPSLIDFQGGPSLLTRSNGSLF